MRANKDAELLAKRLPYLAPAARQESHDHNMIMSPRARGGRIPKQGPCPPLDALSFHPTVTLTRPIFLHVPRRCGLRGVRPRPFRDLVSAAGVPLPGIAGDEVGEQSEWTARAARE